MQGIAAFLKRFENFTTPARAAKRAVARAVGERFAVEISEEAVSIREGGAFVSVPGVLKSEIVINKSVILARVAELLGTPAVKDLR